MKKIILILLIHFHLITFSQNISIVDEVHLLESDQFENIFIVTKNNTLFKYPKNDYNNYVDFLNTENGIIEKIMIENPFRLMVFYKESQKILFLDKYLNQLNVEINLDQLLNEAIIDVANFSNLLFLISDLNKIFVYDIGRSKIVKSKNILLSEDTESINIFSNKNRIFLLENASIKILNHQLDILYQKENKWVKKINKIIFDHEKIYEYSYEEDKLFLIQADNEFEKILEKNLSDSIFTIKNQKMFLIKNKILHQQLLK